MRKGHIKRNDIVAVVSGSGAISKKTGKVLQILPDAGRAIVEGVNYIHKALKKSQDNPQGGIIQKEAPVAISNLMLYCPHCKKGVRVSYMRTESGKRNRKCKICEHNFDI